MTPRCSLLEHCRKHKYLAKSGETFVRLVVRLMERLLDYRTIMHDENKENRMSCTVNVLVSGCCSRPWGFWELATCGAGRGFRGRTAAPAGFLLCVRGGRGRGTTVRRSLRCTLQTLTLKAETKNAERMGAP